MSRLTLPAARKVQVATADPAPRGNRLARAVRAAFSELFGPGRAATGPAESRRIARSSYAGAETTRFNLDWRTGNAAADDDIRGSIMLLRARARDLARNDPYIQRYVGLLLSNVIGSNGVTHQAQVKFRNPDGSEGALDEATNDTIEAAWKDWCKSRVSVDGKLSFASFSNLQLETCGIDGEAFTRTVFGHKYPYGLGLQPIDPDLVAENYTWQRGRGVNEVRLGVEVDEEGREVAFYVWDWPAYTPGSLSRGLERIPATEVLHHFRTRRAHQTRGVTWLASVVNGIQDLGGYDESVIIGARAGANQVAIAQWKDPSAAPPPSTNDGEARKPVQMDLNPGTITELDPGLEMVGFDPKQPSGVYAEFTKTVLRRIANGLGVSYASLANDLREVNYSSTKVGMMVERELWKVLQEWWVESYVQPVYERWLQAATLTGTLRLPDPDWRAYSAVSWSPRRWPWTEPAKEIGATEKQIELGLTSRQRVLAEQSDGDYRKLIEELKQEREIADKAGVSIMPAAPAAPAPADEPPADPRGEAAEPDDDEPAQPRKRSARANRVAVLERNGHR